jgi:hypothetical protein
MALQTSPQSSSGVLGAIRGVMGLFTDVNKTDGSTEDATTIPTDEYESTLDDDEILQIISQRKRSYSIYYSPVEKSQALAFGYWLGNQKSEAFDVSDTQQSRQDLVDNLIFKAVETFLPIATRANPDPLVTADPSDLSQQMAKDIQVALVDWADNVKFRRKLARATRNWTWGRIGVLKVYWEPHTKAIKVDVINPKRMMFDKDGYVDEGGVFVGEWEAEKKKATADKLIEMFPKKKDAILAKAKDKLGTKLEYIEWWDKSSDLFFTIDDNLVLGKYKNPNWNYDGTVKEKDPDTGAEIETEVQGTNHLKERTSPYRYLSVFSTGLQPHDETSLILQNIGLQDSVNGTLRQIEKNVQSMNNGMVVSGKSFTEDQAAQASSALRRGVSIRVPNGDVREAVQRFPAPPLPADVYSHLQDSRQQIEDIFGTSGSTPQGLEGTDTVRGKVLVNQMDSSRIGGGITECIEQLADSVYNLVVQFMFVYYDEEHFITTAGAVAGTELITLKNANFPLLKTLSVTVKEGSLVPKDPLTQRNEAVDLWSENAIDPLSLFKKLDFPDPVQATQQLILWQMLQKGQIQPQMYLPTFQIQGQGTLPTEQPATGGNPINPPTGQNENPPAEPTSGEAIGSQSSALLGAVKI